MPEPTNDASSAGREPRFPTTRWSLVTLVGDTRTPEAQSALGKLCHAYWYPLYAFSRRGGISVHDSQDLVQSFFADLLQRNWLKEVGREQGRFRTFLIACFRHFRDKEWRRAHAARRTPPGGWIPLELETAEGRYRHEPAVESSPEQLFERQWALAAVDRVLHQLRSEYVGHGKTPLFEKLHGQLSTDRALPGFYAAIAGDLAMTEGAVRTSLSRMRDRFGDLLRREIEDLVSSPLEVEDEIRHLLAAYGAG